MDASAAPKVLPPGSETLEKLERCVERLRRQEENGSEKLVGVAMIWKLESGELCSLIHWPGRHELKGVLYEAAENLKPPPSRVVLPGQAPRVV